VLTPEIRAFAQVPDRFTRMSADVARDDDGRRCIVQGSVWAGVAGVRVGADEVEALVEEVRSLVPREKLLTWWIDADAQPADLEDRLRALGLREPEDGGYLLHALACVTEPAAGPPDVEVRKVETFEDYVEAVAVMWDAFETPPERREQQRPHLRDEFEAQRAAGTPGTFVAFVDGEPAGVGRSVYAEQGSFCIAGAVLPRFRGRGVYRSLVRARWDDAVERGTPALVTEAIEDTSYPILLRLGFREVSVTRRLEDRR
jgi:GNAT superfamily N-acetyltransferase